MKNKLINIVSAVVVIFLLIFISEFYKAKLTKKEVLKSKSAPKVEVYENTAEAIIVSKELENTNAKLQEELNVLKKENDNLKMNSLLYQENLNGKEDQLQAKFKETEALKERLALLELEMKSKKVEKNMPAKPQTAAIDVQVKEYKKIIEEIFNQNKNLTKSLTRAEEEVKKLSSKIKALENDKNRYGLTQVDKDKLLKGYSTEIITLQNENVNLNVKLQQSLKDSKNLTDALSGFEAEKKRMLDLISGLEKEKNSLIDEKEKVKLELNKLRNGMQNKDVRTKNLEDEIVNLNDQIKVLNSQWELAKKKSDGVEGDLAKRAERVLRLQESLDDKNNIITKLTTKLEEQLKDLAGLREGMVKIKLENSSLIADLQYKAELLNVLQGEMQKISEVNSQFKENINKAFQAIGSENQKAGSGKNSSDKEVKIELDSVASDRDSTP